MPAIVAILLFLHVLGAIVAFGPTFAFPLIGAMGGREPVHANFATRASLRIEERMVVPLAIVQGITGAGLIVFGGFDLLATHWLLLGIVLYAIALTFAIVVQTRSVERVVELTTMPAGGPPPGPPAGGPPPGPPPGLLDAVRRVQRGGMLLSVLIVSIVFLMVVKPAF
jgi:uncharacterized membrane protein